MYTIWPLVKIGRTLACERKGNRPTMHRVLFNTCTSLPFLVHSNNNTHTYATYVHLLDTWLTFPFLSASLLLPYSVFNRGNETSLFLFVSPLAVSFVRPSTATSSRTLSKLSTMDFVPVARFLFRTVPRSNRFYSQRLMEESGWNSYHANFTPIRYKFARLFSVRETHRSGYGGWWIRFLNLKIIFT